MRYAFAYIIKCIYNNLEVFSSLILSFVNYVWKWESELKSFLAFWWIDLVLCLSQRRFFFHFRWIDGITFIIVNYKHLTMVICYWLILRLFFWISFVFSIYLTMHFIIRMLFLNDASQFVRNELDGMPNVGYSNVQTLNLNLTTVHKVHAQTTKAG